MRKTLLLISLLQPIHLKQVICGQTLSEAVNMLILPLP
jgi:hypothetical protein